MDEIFYDPNESFQYVARPVENLIIVIGSVRSFLLLLWARAGAAIELRIFCERDYIDLLVELTARGVSPANKTS